MKRIVVLVLSLFLLSGCKESVSRTDFYFDTIISVSIHESNKDMDKIFTEVFDLCKEYEFLLSKTIPESDVSAINVSNGSPTEVSDSTISLINKAIEYSILSDGVFDITINPISTLWDFKRLKTVPDSIDIEHALAFVDYNNISINGNYITLTNQDASIDLGGIAKGYIADKIKEYLESEGITNAIINLGGNILTIGPDNPDETFKIGIQKPFSEQNELIGVIKVNNLSVVTSGSYERYFYENNTLYHHILNPETGYPSDSDVLSVTIISESSTDGDALSTICFLLGAQSGLELIESLENTEAIFVTNDYEIIKSSGIGTTIKFEEI